jgi:hypothetical protein
MKKIIEIFGNNSEILSISLTDILNCHKSKEQYLWSLLWVDGVIINKEVESLLHFRDVVDFEESINNSINGRKVSIEDLKKIDLSSSQILGLLLISDLNDNNLKRFNNNSEMYKNCSTVIELIDGAYWEVCTDNIDFRKNIFDNLDGVKYSLQ